VIRPQEEIRVDERREEARDSIRFRVWSGYYDAHEVFDSIVDDVWFDRDEEDDKWLRSAIRREFQLKRKAERSWPAVTSCDRLDGVFEALRSQGILTRHRCGLTIQDGLDVIHGLQEEAGGKRSGLIGYCFYHLQDMEAAMWGETGLWLAFGSFPPSRKGAVAVGQTVRKEFERAGFMVDWDGTADTRLLLTGFRWQRRSVDPE
jgi:uncharacterized protein DUF6891